MELAKQTNKQTNKQSWARQALEYLKAWTSSMNSDLSVLCVFPRHVTLAYRDFMLLQVTVCLQNRHRKSEYSVSVGCILEVSRSNPNLLLIAINEFSILRNTRPTTRRQIQEELNLQLWERQILTVVTLSFYCFCAGHSLYQVCQTHA
jgi:hypothetical protein